MGGVRIWGLVTFLWCSVSVFATPYWIAWEGNDYPENEGWERIYNNAGAVRSLAAGVMTLDGMPVAAGYDIYSMHRPSTIDPAPGETFTMRW